MPGVEIAGEAVDGQTALALISTLKPDLVFLDLEMPTMTGFQMIEQLHETPAPVIVIVTAFDQHAIKAFEVGAVDYLLKPVNQTRLAQAVERAGKLAKNPVQIADQIGHIQNIGSGVPASTQVHKVVGKLGEEYFLLDLQEVLAFQAEGDLTWIVTAKQRYLAAQNLKTIERRLQNSAFRRIRRGALVNVNQIRKMSMLSSQRWLMTLTNGQELIVSKRQAKNVRPFLSW